MNHAMWQTLGLSLQISALATLLALLVAIPLAYLNSRLPYRGKSLAEALIVLPMVLPPTVVGYLIILTLGRQGWVGHYLERWFSYSIMFQKEGAVLAAATVALPLLYLPTRAAFAAVSGEMEDAARMMGANPLQIFWHVSLPLASRGVASGLMLAYARALGEFGATVMVFGTVHPTLPISIWLDSENGEFDKAWPGVVLLCVISISLTLVYNRSRLSRQE